MQAYLFTVLIRNVIVHMVLNCKFNDVQSSIANAAQPGSIFMQGGLA